MDALEKLDGLLERFESWMIVAIFWVFILLLAFNILMRNVFQVSFQDILERTPMAVLWLALLGASIGIRKGKHIKLELVLRYVPSQWAKIARRLTAAFGAVVMAMLLVASFDFISSETDMFGAWGYLALIMPMFFAVALFRFGLKAFLADP